MRSGRVTHIVGFGSQAAAWARMSRRSGEAVQVYLPTPTERGSAHAGGSDARARELGFPPSPLSRLAIDLAATPRAEPVLVAMLCPDAAIGLVYRDWIARVPRPVTLVLAHGYAVYSGELSRLAPSHDVALLAPKAIGPRLLAAFECAFPQPHDLVAAFHATPGAEARARGLASALGFAPNNLVPASFEQETIGDLISEQGLLCGGVFALLEATMANMEAAGVPARLIREECLTELELIAGLLREKGPASTFAAISEAAKAGTVIAGREFARAGLPSTLRGLATAARDGSFRDALREGRWRAEALALEERLAMWQKKLGYPT